MSLSSFARMRAGWLLVLAVFCRGAANANEIPNLVLPAGVGVNIHFIRGHERDLDMIAAAGFKFVRMDFLWSETERKKGIYDWSAYDELTANLEKRGLHAYYILDYSNPLYETNVIAKNPISGKENEVLASPQHPESIVAFARWAAAAAKHFQGHHVIWEIWNEPNISFWEPRPDVNQYTTLALATAKAIRAADPYATIVGPTSSGFPWPFLESFLKSGVLKYLDGVSVHPYRPPNSPPETAASDFKKLRELIARNAPPSRKNSIPIISGEWGYSSNTRGVSPEVQAEFIVRQQLSNLMNGVPISIWYDWENDGNDPNENEQNFGTVRSNLSPKPAYLAIKTFTHELAGFGIGSRCHTASRNDFVLVMTNAVRATKLAAWTLGAPHSITLQLRSVSNKNITVIDGDGTKHQVEIKSNRLVLSLDGAPRYVDLNRLRLN
jgi:polysaccharide biosynthesis protein PslG